MIVGSGTCRAPPWWATPTTSPRAAGATASVTCTSVNREASAPSPVRCPSDPRTSPTGPRPICSGRSRSIPAADTSSPCAAASSTDRPVSGGRAGRRHRDQQSGLEVELVAVRSRAGLRRDDWLVLGGGRLRGRLVGRDRADGQRCRVGGCGIGRGGGRGGVRRGGRRGGGG